MPQRHDFCAHTSTLSEAFAVLVAVMLLPPLRVEEGVVEGDMLTFAVPVVVALLPPLREGVGGGVGEVLRTPDLDPLRVLVRVTVGVEERDSVRVPLGDRVVEGLALPLIPPLPVAVVVDEVAGEARVGR